MALRKQLSRDLAVAMASGKTNARQTGINEQKSFLGDMTKAAETLYNMGSQMQSQGTAALGQAADAQKSAAGLISSQGNMLNDAGKLRAEAGTLYANAATIFGNAANVEGNAASLQLDAIKNIVAAASDAYKYYQGISQSMIAADAQVATTQISADARVASAIAS